ncbi:LOW QUALITY PROTEIN: uncharacterized protein Z519_11072 [Cladophialophora bantiana CBS 173.52]|uniref:Uncharacterized protein n=1 Tax=Cladophialophora bantiana (strain ATCC 10958 / CBS 173.52 / CDC B-1940 / NIH 8579) TaxID=1442370 RepID=A0A0D2H5G2_CLAB1|nr:LOW QUALITY PROTEIN: uncharacterized protein Z519_11072 [Cladophialophora bantiana CBS 173.52]KIW88503.1 LOW QUALITY PROTEIN: hypothetical protein Z519_11072 [Cladophialophora bantiana CBS 173.52]
MIWGDEVEQELRTEGIKQSQVIRHLKASLFDAQILSQRTPQQELSRSLTEMRKVELKNSLQSCGEDADDYQLETLSLYSDYMVAMSFISLQRPMEALVDPFATTASSTKLGTHRETCKFTFRCHYRTNSQTVAERASALIHHLFKSRADGQSIIGKRYLISDVGAGSADHQVWEVVEQQPLQLREVGIPEEAKTAWCGGAFVNQIATQQIMRDIRDIDRVLRATQRSNGPSDRQSFELKIAKKFEKEKLRFEGRETIYLRI